MFNKTSREDKEYLMIVNKIIIDKCVEFVKREYRIVRDNMIINSKIVALVDYSFYSNWNSMKVSDYREMLTLTSENNLPVRLNLLIANIVCTIGMRDLKIIKKRILESIKEANNDYRFYIDLLDTHPYAWIIPYIQMAGIDLKR